VKPESGVGSVVTTRVLPIGQRRCVSKSSSASKGLEEGGYH
jgi:hypothetical protein